VVVLVLLAGAAAVAVLPHGAGAVRIGGLSVLWWYAAVVAPCLIILVAFLALLRRPPVADPAAAEVPPA
jgi:hypothetical protein